MREYKLTDSVYYFAYGSNMNPERMIERGAPYSQIEMYALRGFSLRFNKASSKEPGRGCANIVSDEKGLVEGVLYNITVQGLYNLDRIEGYPSEYDRVRLTLDLNGSRVTVKTYIAMPDKISDGLYPSRSYIEHLLRAKDLVSEEYYNFLENIETID